MKQHRAVGITEVHKVTKEFLSVDSDLTETLEKLGKFLPEKQLSMIHPERIVNLREREILIWRRSNLTPTTNPRKRKELSNQKE
jgi:hypothetical protein